MESIINSSRCSAGRLTLAGRWIRAKEDPDIRVVRDRFEAFVQVGSLVTVTGVAVEDPVKPQCQAVRRRRSVGEEWPPTAGDDREGTWPQVTHDLLTRDRGLPSVTSTSLYKNT